MSEATLISYAQNGEDVVLWRALHTVADGRYVDVGAGDPVDLSVTKALYDRGWRGIDIDAAPDHVVHLRGARPGDEVVEATVTDRPLTDAISLTLDAVCEQSSLIGDELHVLKVDVGGAEDEVLRSFDLQRWKPWVVVVRVVRGSVPTTSDWEPVLLAAGYQVTLFDGLSRYFVSPDHPELVRDLSYPACAVDDYVPVRQHLQDLRVDELVEQVAEARRGMLRWRNEAVSYWSNAVSKAQQSQDDAKRARSETERMRGQLRRARESLQEIRADRKQLRQKLKQKTARIDRMAARLEQLSADAPPARPADSLRRALKRVARS